MFRKPTQKTPTGEMHRHMLLLGMGRNAAGSVVASINYVSHPISSSLVNPVFDYTRFLHLISGNGVWKVPGGKSQEYQAIPVLPGNWVLRPWVALLCDLGIGRCYMVSCRANIRHEA